MRPAFSHPALLGGAVVLRVRSGVIVMEAHAPAAAKDAVVALHQRGERGPRRLIEGLHGVRRFGHESSLTRTTARASSSRTSGATLTDEGKIIRPRRLMTWVSPPSVERSS